MIRLPRILSHRKYAPSRYPGVVQGQSLNPMLACLSRYPKIQRLVMLSTPSMPSTAKAWVFSYQEKKICFGIIYKLCFRWNVGNWIKKRNYTTHVGFQNDFFGLDNVFINGIICRIIKRKQMSVIIKHNWKSTFIYIFIPSLCTYKIPLIETLFSLKEVFWRTIAVHRIGPSSHSPMFDL